MELQNIKNYGYSVHSGDQVFVKSYGFLSFAINIGKHIGKNIMRNLSGKYSVHAKKIFH